MGPAELEIAKAGLMIFFTMLKTAGKTPEQMAELYSSEKKEYFSKRPEDLPDVED